MNKPELQPAIISLLAEYKKAIDDLVMVIKPLTKERLIQAIYPETTNPDCKSIQSILTHIVASIFSYSVYIENHIGLQTIRPEYSILENAQAYTDQLYAGYAYCELIFIQNPGIQLEESENSKKINANWGQQYDIDQMMEHSIVHILRHRRQIENEMNLRKNY